MVTGGLMLMYLLDCTLRDGGYVNDWEFGFDNIINIYERLVSAKVAVSYTHLRAHET